MDFIVLLLDKLDQAGLFNAKPPGASRRLRPYDCPEPRPGTLFVLQNTYFKKDEKLFMQLFTLILLSCQLLTG